MKRLIPAFIFLTLPALSLGQVDCRSVAANPSGNAIEAHFFPIPKAIVRDAVSDAMRTVGVVLIEDGDERIYGNRDPLAAAMVGLPKSDDTMRATVMLSVQNGREGSEVRIETLRNGKSNKPPKQIWSGTVLEETGCILSALSGIDPHKLPSGSVLAAAESSTKEVIFPAGTIIRFHLRRYLKFAELHANQRIDLEVAEDVRIGDAVVIRKGALAGARNLVMDFVTSVDGQRIPMKGAISGEQLV